MTGTKEIGAAFRRVFHSVRYGMKRITFHNHAASKIAAEFMYFFPTRERKECVREILDVLGKEPSENSWKENRALIHDILYAKAFYTIRYKDYYMFGLDQQKTEDKRNYVGWCELYHYYELLNRIGRPEIFDRKEKTYEAFREFYHREAIFVSSEQGKALFLSFFERHAAGIVKPTAACGGQGVAIIHAADYPGSEEMWEAFRKKTPFVLEELIEQAPEMDVFYPNAVNTIRYNTFYHNGQLTRMQAIFRIGRGGSNVDNATSGGIFTRVDTETGQILGPARSLRRELFERHPDTGVLLEGSYIPRWSELNELVEKVVRVVPQQKQVGWDFALSKQGWVIVEANTPPGLQSFDPDHGLRGLLHQTFGQVIPMWE